jgi:3-oxoacyl-[acyl-carrier-protein] synthase II
MSPSTNERGRVGIYGWGVVAPGARNVEALVELLRTGASALAPSKKSELGPGLFAVGEPDFTFDDYADWIVKRHGAPYVSRMLAKMTDNVQFAIGATIQALGTPELEAAVKELDEQCHIYVGSGVGDLPESYKAAASLTRATREWNHFWANPARCAERRRFHAEGTAPAGATVPPDPATLPVDSHDRFDALGVWDAFWAGLSTDLKTFLERFAAVEKLGSASDADEDAHLHAIRKRIREHRKLLDEVGCPVPPWTSVNPNLIWNIQNSPAAQITMLLDVHGEAWAPVGACSTFGVALSVGREAILRGHAKLAIIGTTDPRPDPALASAFHQARVMPGTGEVNRPFTSLRGTHISGGACVWIIGDPAWCEARGLKPVGGYVESVALASDAEHIITPSKTGPKRAIVRAYEEAGITPADVAQIDLHATGTPGDLNELALVDEFINPQTRVTARKGQLGHGMANSGGWELTCLALDLAAGVASSAGITTGELHPRIPRPEAIAASGPAPLSGDVGVKLMLGVGGITACVVLRKA